MAAIEEGRGGRSQSKPYGSSAFEYENFAGSWTIEYGWAK